MRRHLSLAVVLAALCAAAPAEALERSDILAQITQSVAYGRAADSYALHDLITQVLPTIGKGDDSWEKLILGIQYEALASWNNQALPDVAAEAPPSAEPVPPGGESDSDQAQSFPDIAIPSPAEQQNAPQEAIDYAEQAITWLKVAVSEGLAAAPDAKRPDGLPYRRAGSLAAEALGELYGFGIEAGIASKGIVTDYVQAYVWFSVAAAENEAGAAQNLAEVSGLLSDDDRADAERRLAAFKSRQGS